MNSFLGLDTSNYTTSMALLDWESGKIMQQKKLLPVEKGKLGLRQSEALFHHVNQLPEVFAQATKNLLQMPIAVGVSAKPRDEIGSYMPCFNVGVSFGKTIAQLLNVPCYEFSHQAGHIAAALYSAKKIELLSQKFLAFHVSGGTTEALLVTPAANNVIKTQIVAKTLDLNAGQLIDRIGIMLGQEFPAGASLEKLALNCNDNFKITPTLKGCDCCLSGIENLCAKMKLEQQDDEKIARFCIEYVGATLEKMCENLLVICGQLPVVFAGGVMSNSIIKNRLQSRFDAIFGKPVFSSDNAVGISVLTAIKVGELR